MKRKIALLMGLLMVALTLFGCAQTELEYLQFLKEMNKALQGRVEGTFEVSFDRQGMEQMSSEISYQSYKNRYESWYGDEEDDIDWEYDFEEYYSYWYDELPDLNYNWSGHQAKIETVAVHYTMDLDYENDMAYHIALAASYNGKDIDFGDFYFTVEDGLYVSGKTLKSVAALAGHYYGEDSIYNLKEFQQGLNQLIDGNQYLHLWDGAGEYMAMEVFALMDDAQNMQDYAFTLLTEAFSGFSTGFVAKSERGFEISMTLDDILAFIPKVIDYILDNETTFYDAVETYVRAIEEYSYERYDYGYLFDEPALYELDQKTREEISEFLEELKTYYNDALSADMLKGTEDSYLKYTIGKEQNDYVYGMEGKFVYRENPLITISDATTYTPKTVKINVPANVMDDDLLYDAVWELEERLNPVTKVSLSWDKDYDWSNDWYDWGEDLYWEDEFEIDQTNQEPDQNGDIHIEDGLLDENEDDLNSGEGIVWQISAAVPDEDLDSEDGNDLAPADDEDWYDDGWYDYDDDGWYDYDYDWYDEDWYDRYFDDTEYLSARYHTKYNGLGGWYSYAGWEKYKLEFHEGILYVPLRSLCENLGVELTWDEEQMRSCAVYNGERVEMDGFVDDGVYYVKARDFEKLGFEVTYDDSSWYSYNVTIEKID